MVELGDEFHLEGLEGIGVWDDDILDIHTTMSVLERHGRTENTKGDVLLGNGHPHTVFPPDLGTIQSNGMASCPPNPP